MQLVLNITYKIILLINTTETMAACILDFANMNPQSYIYIRLIVKLENILYFLHSMVEVILR